MISVYYPYDFEAHKNLSHKQFLIQVYYFMDYAVAGFGEGLGHCRTLNFQPIRTPYFRGRKFKLKMFFYQF